MIQWQACRKGVRPLGTLPEMAAGTVEPTSARAGKRLKAGFQAHPRSIHHPDKAETETPRLRPAHDDGRNKA